jgi:hypothetical protein
MKKFISLLLVLVLAFALVACGGAPAGNEGSNEPEKEPETTTPSEPEVVEEPVKVCFIIEQLGDNSFADASDRSLKEYEQKYGIEYFCTRPPDLVLSGINYGSNASINIAYSGTMGAVLEACLDGCQSIGFSLLNHSPEADFEAASSFIRHIIDSVLQHPLPDYTALNVNIPRLDASQIKGIRVCRQARASWVDSLEKRIDPIGRPYWWMTGKFVCDNPPADSDEYLLAHGYATVVPIHPDFTAYHHLDNLKQIEL